MAEAVISIAGSILANLITQALEKAGKLGGVKDQLVLLEATVSMLRVVLDHAEERYHQSPQIKDWVEKLKDAFYDAQDVLEEFNIEAMRREQRGDNEMIKKVRKFFSSSNQLAFELKMSRKVRIVRERIEVLEAKNNFHLDKQPMDSQVEREWRKGEETYSFICKEDIIGRDDDKKKVMEFLLDLEVTEDVSILPIVGIGGLGKTALAQFVYNEETVGKHFHLKMWVCVSNDFDMKKVVKNIIACVNRGGHNGVAMEQVAMEQLQSELRAKIDGKRYLLVLDDLWIEDPEKWLRLKKLLGGGARGSKILITTRLQSVVKITGTTSPHLLRDLSESASVNLLMQMACQKEEEIQDPEMLAIVKEIARKCSGVPLVVRTVGHLLSSKKTKSEWLRFKDDELPDVSQSKDSINSVLMLSYNHLPSHLKQCFAFCSLFPKDYEIKKQTLVDLWMAEGFIQPSNKIQDLEDIAHKYFMDLLWSNFFQDFREASGTCKMHDLMHDLACSVARTECWAAWNDTKLIHERTRHISCDSTSNLMGKPLISCLKASALRTFFSITRNGEREPISEANLCQLIQSFKRLRVLDLHGANVEKVPRFICKLKHLTYLDLSYNDALKRVPNSITRLHNLQTLNLCCCKSLKKLPRGMMKLVSLRNLDINYCDKLSYMPCGLGQLSLLHRLSCFILPKDKALAKKYCGLGELNKLNNIQGRLSIENLGSVTNAVEESQAANLREKRSLEVLRLSWGTSNITDEAMIAKRDEALLDGLRPPNDMQELIIDGYNGESLPRWMTELPNLVKLKLLSFERLKHLPQFGLGKLKCLDMNGMNSLEYIPEECLKSLTSLESLEIWNLPRLTSLPLGLRHLSSLKSLQIWNLPRLTSLPLGLRHLSKLVDLTICYCKELDLSKDESGNIILDFHGLQSLRYVEFYEIPKLESLPQWILQLRSLENLIIRDCKELDLSKDESGNIILDCHGLQSLRSLKINYLPKLESLPQWILQARSLKFLEILYCPNFKESSEQIEKCEELNISKDESGNILDFHGGLPSLRSVRIFGLPKLTSLPQWLPQARNLECLGICECHSLKDIPEQIEALQSLQNLSIGYCSSLTSFPEAMRRLTSLTHLSIFQCKELKESCRRKEGKDWDKIAHIPNIFIE